MLDLALLARARRLGQGAGREVRERAGLSVGELARIIGVDVATLSRWERGRTRPRANSAQRWFEACKIIEGALDDAATPPILGGASGLTSRQDSAEASVPGNGITPEPGDAGPP